ncbi:unnamed protein product, partial [Onchocerca flexuosa]
MAASSLTAEQLKRIERNRAEAMRRMALRQQREREVENIKNMNVMGNNYSTIDTITCGNTSSIPVKVQPMVQSKLGPLNSSNKVSVTVRDENRPVQLQIAKSHDESKFSLASSDQLSPKKYVITYRDKQQPSTSALAVPTRIEMDHKLLPVSSPIKRPPVVTAIQLRQNTINISFKLIDPKSFQ